VLASLNVSSKSQLNVTGILLSILNQHAQLTQQAPEALRGGSDERPEQTIEGDVWSLGALLFFAYTGRMPLEKTKLDALAQSDLAAADSPIEFAISTYSIPLSLLLFIWVFCSCSLGIFSEFY